MVHKHLHKNLQKIRGKNLITKEELIADIIYLFIAAVVSFIALFIFDVHHSFYDWPIFPLKFIFQTHEPYYYGVLIGTIVGFFLIKLFLFALYEERVARKRKGKV